MNRITLNQKIDELGLDEALRAHLLWLFEGETSDQVEDILQAFSVEGLASGDMVDPISLPRWADAAAVRVLARMELPAFGRLRLCLSQCIYHEVERLVNHRRGAIS